jgi:hypothetical protein
MKGDTVIINGQVVEERLNVIKVLCSALASVTANGFYRKDFGYIKKSSKRLTKRILRACEDIDSKTQV